MRYLRLDLAVAAVREYVAYRIRATRCFFSGSRLGHDWKGLGCLYDECASCPKTFVGNL